MMEARPKADDRKRVYNNRLVCVITEEYERILIGAPEDIRERLEGHEVHVDLDIIKPFGTMLLTLDYDKESWKNAIHYLEQAQESLHTRNIKKGRRLWYDGAMWAPDYEKQALEILNEKYDTEDPISQYVAMRIWYGYWFFREKKDSEPCANFLKLMANMVRPFEHKRWAIQTGFPIAATNPIFSRMIEKEDCDSEQLIFSVSTPVAQEYITIGDSLLPLEKYYMSKCVARKNYIIECKECKKPFIAKSLRYQLCSDECREQARVKNLAIRKEKGDTAEVDRICNNALAHWNSRLSRMRKSGMYSEEQLKQYIAVKKKFQKAKNKKRQDYKNGKIPFQELQDFLLHQEQEAQLAMEQLMVTKW